MRFDDSGFFWEPFKYQSQKRAGRTEAAPRIPPPIPATGWKPPTDFPDLSRAKFIGLDTETCDPDLREKGPGVRRGAYICGVSVATEDFSAYYPIKHSVETQNNLDPEKVFRWLKVELARKQQPKVGANILYDLDFLAEAGVEVKGECYDIQYADPLIDEYCMSYSLDAIAERRIGAHKETSLLYQWCADAYGGPPSDEQRENIWRSPPSLVGPYAEADARLPVQIIRKQMELMRESGVVPIFKMECGLIPLLLKMRRRGVLIDLKRTQEIDDELSALIDTKQKEVGIDVFAGAQIAALCDKEGIKYPRTAPSKNHPNGQPSFVKDWLKKHEHPILRGVSDLRAFYKLRDTFVRGHLLGSHVNGRVHCLLHPLRTDENGTVSGRYSSSDPNLQQIPARDKYWGPRLRSAFIPEDGRAWMKNDLSQIEFRLAAHYGVGKNAEEVRAQYNKDPKTDFYSIAVEMTGLERQDAKSLSLGTLYGMRYKKFGRMTGKSNSEARDTFEQFNEKLPFMHETFDSVQSEAEAMGFVRTIGGRICHLNQGFEYRALNRKMQGSCADWIKKSMLDGYRAGIFDELDLQLTVHDELDSGVLPTRAGVEAMRELDRIMANAYPLSVPVLAGCDVGRSWGELEDLSLEPLTPALVARAMIATTP